MLITLLVGIQCLLIGLVVGFYFGKVATLNTLEKRIDGLSN